MKTARLLFGLLGAGSGVALVLHLLYAGGNPWGWFAAPRKSKTVMIQHFGAPTDDSHWTANLGDYRPEQSRRNEVLSEVEMVVKHVARGGAPFVHITITADSEREIDSLVNTLRLDVERAYADTWDTRVGPIPRENALLLDDTDPPETTYYWRQNYLLLLCVNFLLCGIGFAALWRAKRSKIERVPEVE